MRFGRLVMALIVLYAGLAAAQTPLPSRSTAALGGFLEAVEAIKREYIEPVDEAKLAAGCRDGMLNAVDPSRRPQIERTAPPHLPVVPREFRDVFASIEKQHPESADVEKMVGACLQGVLKTLDPISSYLDEEASRELRAGSAPVGGVGVELMLESGFPVVVATIEGGPGERAGLKTGDIVAAIDAASTREKELPDIVKVLRGAVGSGVTLTIVREGDPQPRTYALTREVIRIQSVRWRTLAPGYAYIRIVQFQEVTGPLVAQAMESAYGENQGELKGVILDLRNNSGGLLNACVAVAAVFLPRGALITYTEGRTDDAKMRLTAIPQNYVRGRKPDFLAKLPPAVKTVPMAVLVNEATVSGSEMLTAALQDHRRAKILGARTFGLGTLTTLFPLQGGAVLKLTTARMFGPNGKAAAPVVPDMPLEKSELPAAKYGSADDAQLIQALKLLGGKL